MMLRFTGVSSAAVWMGADHALKLQLLWKGWKDVFSLKNMSGGLSLGALSGTTAALLSSVGNRLR